MLVLTRKTQQQIQIGPDITVTVLQVKGQSVRLGIEAPRDVCVLRTELATRLADQEAAQRIPDGAPSSGHAEGVDQRESATESISAKSVLRCRAPRTVRAPLSRHLKRPGPASRFNSHRASALPTETLAVAQ